MEVGEEREQLVANVGVEAEEHARIRDPYPGVAGAVEVREPAQEVAARVGRVGSHEARVRLGAVALLERAHGDPRHEAAAGTARELRQQDLVLRGLERPDVHQHVREPARERGPQRLTGARDHRRAPGPVMVLAGQKRDGAEPAAAQDVELRVRRRPIGRLAE